MTVSFRGVGGLPIIGANTTGLTVAAGALLLLGVALMVGTDRRIARRLWHRLQVTI
jgi:hypothetical protein